MPPSVGIENREFMGWLLLILLLCEIARLVRVIITKNVTRLDRLSMAALVAGVALILVSFGPDFRLLGVSPYKVLHSTFLQFTSFFRAPARFFFVSHWFLLIPVCILFARTSALNRPRISMIAVGVCVPWIMLEHLPAREPLNHAHDQGILSHMDLHDPAGSEAYIDLNPEMDLRLAVAGAPRWQLTANGWKMSSLGKKFDRRTTALEWDFPSTTTLGWLARNKVGWIVVRDEDTAENLDLHPGIERISPAGTPALYRFVSLEEFASRYDEYMQTCGQTITAERKQTPDKLTIPATSFQKFAHGQLAQFENFTRIPREPDAVWYGATIDPLPGGSYDEITITYRMTGNCGKHRPALFWGDDYAFSLTRHLKGSRDELNDDPCLWQATFAVGNAPGWMHAPDVRWLGLRLDRFRNGSPGDIEILDVSLCRWPRPDGLALPEIDHIAETRP